MVGTGCLLIVAAAFFVGSRRLIAVILKGSVAAAKRHGSGGAGGGSDANTNADANAKQVSVCLCVPKLGGLFRRSGSFRVYVRATLTQQAAMIARTARAVIASVAVWILLGPS